ncbi:hypothetical protein NQ317_018652, partial [Molorchus minor]
VYKKSKWLKTKFSNPSKKRFLNKKEYYCEGSLSSKFAVAAACVQPANANIRVVVRVRPPNDREKGGRLQTRGESRDDQMLIFDPKEDAQAFFFHGIQQRGRDLLKKSNKDLQFIFA